MPLSALRTPRLRLPGLQHASATADAPATTGWPPRRHWQPRPGADRGATARPDARGLVRMASARQRLVLVGLATAWLASSAFFFAWWLEPAHLVATGGTIATSIALAMDLVILPAWFWFWIWRMRRPAAADPDPGLRVAMVVTKVPSEPWELVRTTLLAMLRQDYPYPYAVWLADEQPTAETRAWCALTGVQISSRHGVDEYHRATWPRRTRTKEGNLAYFYDHAGCERYDVVAQLDADHVPNPDYLRHMVAPFSDPLVGYVAAPSICDRNAATSWSARGRLYAEATLHGAMQAGANGGFSPSCIGSHYAVRTAAVRQIGGIGPELAEDFTTTLMMSSHRWQGVFAIDAEAHGDGPASIADCMVQEFQWSRSMMNVLLRVSPRYWRGLSAASKLRLGFCQVWYPLFGLLMLGSVVLPMYAVVTHTPLVTVPLGTFVLHFLVPIGTLVGAVLWLRRQDWLRPHRAKVVSWEAVLFQLVRWPWALLGCAQSIVDCALRREFTFRVTPKDGGPQPFPLAILLPYVALALACSAPVILVTHPGAAQGYDLLNVVNACLYLGAGIAITALHMHENRRTIA